MRSQSVGVLLFLLGLVSSGQKKNSSPVEEKDGSAESVGGCIRYQNVCTQLPSRTEDCETQRVRRCFTVDTRTRGKRSPQLLQALLLYQALRTRHPERAEVRREVRCHLVPRTSCHPPPRRCSLQPVNIC